jgi:methyl-accepting chemotaxis protein
MAEENAAMARQGDEVMGEVVQVMSHISSSSQRIGDIIGTIDGIAFQTNILALNAAVEAARAGDAGRGFAVVAAEVRSLAQRSSQASREIKVLIQTSVEQAGAGAQVVGRARDAIDKMLGETADVRRLISEIAAGARDQATGVQQIGSASQTLDRSTQGNAALVEQTAAACSAMRDSAQALASRVELFKV